MWYVASKFMQAHSETKLINAKFVKALGLLIQCDCAFELFQSVHSFLIIQICYHGLPCCQPDQATGILNENVIQFSPKIVVAKLVVAIFKHFAVFCKL